VVSANAGERPLAVLVGPPGAGKTTVAAALAELLGVTVHDTDAAVVADEGRPISDIFVEDGEAHFRGLERAAVAAALRDERGVVAVGGGAPLDPATRRLLADHVVVFLDVAIGDAARRIGFDQSRPLLSINPRATWIAMMRERRPVYESVATHRVDTNGRTPEEIAAEVASLISSAVSAVEETPDVDEHRPPAPGTVATEGDGS
jgi:shikimate kinase